MTVPEQTLRTKVRRRPKRGAYDRPVIDAILDEARVCHLGVIDGDYPVVTPTLHARVGDWLYLHGSAANRTLQAALTGEVCLTATLLDGMVLARAAFHHSVNYRSVTVFGSPEPVSEPQEKLRALEAFVEKIIPGRWGDARPPTDNELRATTVLRLALTEASAKIRRGPPADDDADTDLPVWAGVLPTRPVFSAPQPDPQLRAGIEVPDYVTRARLRLLATAATMTPRDQRGERP